MQKIPTVFRRDWQGDRSRVTDQVNIGCEWVLAGEGYPTRKIDGTCCMVRAGKLYKRREVHGDAPIPIGFEIVEDDMVGKLTGWVPVGEGPEDRWHREAFADTTLPDGTYELIGPKIQGNHERVETHQLINHDSLELVMRDEPLPRTFESIRDWLTGKDIEGIVYRHPTRGMAKIKLRDFGLERTHEH